MTREDILDNLAAVGNNIGINLYDALEEKDLEDILTIIDLYLARYYKQDQLLITDEVGKAFGSIILTILSEVITADKLDAIQQYGLGMYLWALGLCDNQNPTITGMFEHCNIKKHPSIAVILAFIDRYNTPKFSQITFNDFTYLNHSRQYDIKLLAETISISGKFSWLCDQKTTIQLADNPTIIIDTSPNQVQIPDLDTLCTLSPDIKIILTEKCCEWDLIPINGDEISADDLSKSLQLLPCCRCLNASVSLPPVSAISLIDVPTDLAQFFEKNNFTFYVSKKANTKLYCSHANQDTFKNIIERV